MTTAIGKREFMHHASKYLRAAEVGVDIVITHGGKPSLRLVKIKQQTLRDLIGFAGNVTVVGDVNEPILGDFLDDIA